MSGAPVVPPLLVLATAAGTAWFLDRIFGPSITAQGSVLWGTGVAALGAAVAVTGVIAFRRAQTTVDPIRPERATSLVATGIYRVTRNPMYLGFVLMLLGWVIALASLSGVLVTSAFFVYLDRVQIPPEEAALRARFGAVYDAYVSRVRRWV